MKHTSSAALGETMDAAALRMDWDILCFVVMRLGYRKGGFQGVPGLEQVVFGSGGGARYGIDK